MSTLRIGVYGQSHLAQTLRAAAGLRGLRTDLEDGPLDIAFAAEDVEDHAQLSDAYGAFTDAVAARVASARKWPIVLVSQVPPGTTRAWADKRENIYYQVDTIIMRTAVARMAAPARFIVGAADPDVPLPIAYQAYLAAHGCPVLVMSYESAELVKCAINFALAGQIKMACDLSRVAEMCGANYADVEAALRSDHRIGPHAYLQPGHANAHLNRDVATIAEILTKVAKS